MECIVNSGNIFYEKYGHGKPIIILHAMGTDHRAMMGWLEPVFQKIAGFQRYYLDVPAHGRSSIDSSVKGTEDMLLMILEFIDAVLPGQRFSLIGMSYGAYLAQGIIHRRKEFVDGVSLISPAIHMPGRVRTLPSAGIIEQDEQLLEGVDPEIIQAYETLMVHRNRKTLDRFLAEVQPGRLLANRGFLSSGWREKHYYFNVDPLSEAGQFDKAVLFILGKQDTIVGYEDQAGILRRFPNVKAAVVEHAGHLIPIEQRTRTQELVGEWLIQVNAPK